MKKGTLVHATTPEGGEITGRYHGPMGGGWNEVVTIQGLKYKIHDTALESMTMPSEMEDMHNLEDQEFQTKNRIYGDTFDGMSLSELDYPTIPTNTEGMPE